MGAGLPVFCEKPCGLSADQAGRAAAAAAAAGLPLQVGYYRRFLPELVALRQRIAAGRLGELSLVVLNQWDEHPPSAEFERRSGGIVVDMGVHEIDQLRWLTGQEVVQVAALTPAPGDQSSAVISLRLSGGTLAAITLGRRFPHPDSCWMEVVGRPDTSGCRSSGPSRASGCCWRGSRPSWMRSRRRCAGRPWPARAAPMRWRRWRSRSGSTGA